MTPFQWDVQEPFSIEPASGTLKPFGTAKMTVYFRPTVSCMTIYFLFFQFTFAATMMESLANCWVQLHRITFILSQIIVSLQRLTM